MKQITVHVVNHGHMNNLVKFEKDSLFCFEYLNNKVGPSCPLKSMLTSILLFDMRDYVQSNRLRSDRVFKTSSNLRDFKQFSSPAVASDRIQ